MSELLDRLSALRRPRLLIRAARHGSLEFNRNRDLRRILRGEVVPGPSRTVPRLMDLEAEAEHSRQSGDAAYSVVRHVDLLIALMAEARLLSA